MVSKKADEPHRNLTRKELDDHLAACLPTVLAYHQGMLTDAVRNKLLLKSIKRAVKPGMSFLDIGAGTGVWAILAAKLGAARVVAVEAEEALIPVIGKLAAENGVNNIEIVHGRSDDVRLKGKFDVIVSELFDGDAFGQATVKSFVDLRTRFLAKGGTLIPERLEMLAAPVFYDRPIPGKVAGLDLSTKFFREVKLNFPHGLHFSEHDRIKFLADPKPLIDLEFGKVVGTEPSKVLKAEWQLRDVSKANCIVLYNRSTFAPGVSMSGLESQSWRATLYPFDPLAKGKGRLSFGLTLDPQNANWTVSTPDAKGSRPQSYSSIFAFTRLKMAHKMTPHKRFKPTDTTRN